VEKIGDGRLRALSYMSSTRRLNGRVVVVVVVAVVVVVVVVVVTRSLPVLEGSRCDQE